MRHVKASMAIGVLVLLTLSAMGQGINFSVKVGSQGLKGTGVAAQATFEAPENDVFIGGGCTNFVRLLHTKLGLQPADDIDALCYQWAPFAVKFMGNLEEDAGWWTADPVPFPVHWHFSVDGPAKGKPLSSVDLEVTSGTQWLWVPPAPNEAHGDYFVSSTALPVPGGGRGSNLLVADEENLTLAIQPSATSVQMDDNLNGLDLIAQPIDRKHEEPPQYLQPGDLFFSLRAGSPSLALVIDPIEGRACHEADILTPDGNGRFRIARTTDGLACDGTFKVLGIPDTNDLDALYCDATTKPGKIPCFSVRDIIPPPLVPYVHPAANPGDILVPDGMIFPLGGPVTDGVADELIPARDLGLRDLEDPLLGIAQYLSSNFAALDSDGSSGLNWAEVSGTGVLSLAQFKELDIDGTGEIDQKELDFWLAFVDDNLDALDAEVRIIEALFPLKGIDDALTAPEGEGEGEGEGEPEGEGETPIEGEGEAPVEGEGEVPVEGEGEAPVEGEGEAPVEGEGEPPVEGEGEPPVEGEGEAPVEGEGEAPIEGEGEAPVEGEGEAPIEGEGEAPIEGEGEAPVEGEGEAPVEGEGETTIEGEGEAPVEGEGEPPVEGEAPVEGEGEAPVEGEGEVPVEGELEGEPEGEAPVEGEGEVPVEGEIEGEVPAEGEGEVPVEG
ncbi:MAG: hypothetical protein GXY07_12970, partial [Candidatus Hydrogenedentes bacterium]|nr:hypothetical protein [Candidatus Hydrogenedentota bacterium]